MASNNMYGVLATAIINYVVLQSPIGPKSLSAKFVHHRLVGVTRVLSLLLIIVSYNTYIQ
jgi:hypothetical protein